MYFLFSSILGLMALAAGALTLGLAINAVWRGVMPPSGLPRTAGCGSCGYELGTVGEGRCPECGADLLKSGIQTRRNAIRLSGSLAAALMGWTVLVGMGGTVLMWVAVMISAMSFATGTQPLKQTDMFAPNGTYNTETGQMEKSADYTVSLVSDVSYSLTTGVQSGTVTIALNTGAGGNAEAVIDVSTTDVSITDGDGLEVLNGQGFDVESAKRLYTAAGLAVDEIEEIAADAEQLAVIYGDFLTQPRSYQYMSTNFRGGGSTSGSLTFTSTVGGAAAGFGGFTVSGGGWYLLGLGALVVVYLGGVVFIVVRRRRMIEGPRALAA